MKTWNFKILWFLSKCFFSIAPFRCIDLHSRLIKTVHIYAKCAPRRKIMFAKRSYASKTMALNHVKCVIFEKTSDIF